MIDHYWDSLLLENAFKNTFIKLLLVFTYLCPLLLVEHTPSTTPCHRTLFWAALVIPNQLVPCCFSFTSVSHLPLLRGRPLFLFPRGFQVRAWHVVLDAGFLRVCPIQPRSSAVPAWPLVSVPHAPTDLHFRSSLAIGFCRCASDRCWRMSGSFVASSVLSAISHICKAGLISHWSWRCGVWFSADSSRCPDVFEHDESCSCFADSGCDASFGGYVDIHSCARVNVGNITSFRAGIYMLHNIISHMFNQSQ